MSSIYLMNSLLFKHLNVWLVSSHDFSLRQSSSFVTIAYCIINVIKWTVTRSMSCLLWNCTWS